MPSSPSKALVRRPEAPLVPVDYRFDLTRRSVAGFVAAGVVVAFLIFLSGLVLGVRLKVDVGETVAPSPAAEAAPAAPMAGREVGP